MPDLRGLRNGAMLGGSLALAVIAAVSVVYCVHLSRQLVSQSQSMRHEEERLQVEWGQLLLEKSAWGSYARVEQESHARLDMYLPSVQEIVVVQP